MQLTPKLFAFLVAAVFLGSCASTYADRLVTNLADQQRAAEQSSQLQHTLDCISRKAGVTGCP